MNRITENTYSVNGIDIEWGKTLEEVGSILQAVEKFKPREGFYGWPYIKFRCSEIFELDTNECDISAPYKDRPILRVTYQLKPIVPGFFESLHTPYMKHLKRVLGEPDKVFKDYKRTSLWKPKSGAVVYSADWKIGAVEISISVYGGTRKEESGPSAAGLFIYWDPKIAAKPFLNIKEKEEAFLQQSIPDNTELHIFSLKERQYNYPRYYDPDDHKKIKAEKELWTAEMALYTRTLLYTPEQIRKRLSVNDVGLYFVPKLDIWLISTHYLTVRLDNIKNGDIQYINLLRGRGPGGKHLKVRELTIEDTTEGTELFKLINKLESELNITVSRAEYYDD